MLGRNKGVFASIFILKNSNIILMTNVYVDESGDLGQGGERFFVIASILTEKSSRIKNIVKHFCAKKNIKEIKASKLTFSEKQKLLNQLSSVEDHKVFYIAVDKKHIYNTKLFEDKNLIYNYIFQHLIKPIIKNSSTDLDIILDNHSTKVKSINSLREYIRIKAYAEWNIKYNINIRYMDSRECKLIQMTDVAANCIYGHYLHNKDHFYRMLRIDKSIRFPHNTFGT
ncbi:MAG: DUF3800 domain-containing protein [Candidatus Taylorbacteria bacterium]